MKICSREFKLKFSKKQAGGCFYRFGRKSEGDAEICIGKYKELHYCAEILCHEIMEAILVEDGKRFSCTEYDPCKDRYLFQFSHDYLDGLGPKLLEALLTSGLFKLVDGR